MPPEYTIHYADKRVLRALQRLPKDALRKLDRELMALKTDPRSRKVKKLKGHKELYELKVWPYRVLFGINDQARVVVLYEIIHRRDLEKYLKRFG
jgi:mRNA interferase RelE/StbE